jgi:hypothetical protein
MNVNIELGKINLNWKPGSILKIIELFNQYNNRSTFKLSHLNENDNSMEKSKKENEHNLIVDEIMSEPEF